MLALDLRILCAELGLEVGLAPCELITVLALFIDRTCAHNGLHTCLGLNKVFRVWVLDLAPISAM